MPESAEGSLTRGISKVVRSREVSPSSLGQLEQNRIAVSLSFMVHGTRLIEQYAWSNPHDKNGHFSSVGKAPLALPW